MQADTGYSPGNADAQQVETLCDDLGERVETAKQEQVLLGELVKSTERTRPHRARQYRVMYEAARVRTRRLIDVFIAFCR